MKKKIRIKEAKNPCPDCGIPMGKGELTCIYCERERQKEKNFLNVWKK